MNGPTRQPPPEYVAIVATTVDKLIEQVSQLPKDVQLDSLLSAYVRRSVALIGVHHASAKLIEIGMTMQLSLMAAPPRARTSVPTDGEHAYHDTPKTVQ